MLWETFHICSTVIHLRLLYFSILNVNLVINFIGEELSIFYALLPTSLSHLLICKTWLLNCQTYLQLGFGELTKAWAGNLIAMALVSMQLVLLRNWEFINLFIWINQYFPSAMDNYSEWNALQHNFLIWKINPLHVLQLKIYDKFHSNLFQY